MDTLRGHYSDHEGGGTSAFDYDPGDDETGRELPPVNIGQDERRLQVRAYNFWASLLQDRNFPPIESLDPDSLPDFGPYSVLLDFTGGVEDPAVRHLGDKLAEECGTEGSIATLADVPSRSLLSRITDHYMQILANQAPIGFEAEFVNQRGSTILYRGILLPFSSDDDAIDYIYGVINWKELADQQTTDELLLEIDQALEEKPGLRSDGPLTEWADGPAEASDLRDLIAPAEMIDTSAAWPEPGFGLGADGLDARPEATSLPEPMRLRDWLESARELAKAAVGSEDRTRQALYAAIGRAYDFALAAAEAPEEFKEIVAKAGLTMQDRAPLTPLVKLVFGADYDKTRLTEYATALTHAQRLGLERGALAEFLSLAPGGLKGVVGAERRLKREENGRAEKPARSAPRETLARKLRKLEPIALSEIPTDGGEFALLVARRLPDGSVALLGEVADDLPLLERAARHLVR